jgi:phosphoglycerate dehydrogenase-like enzyme
MPQGISNHDILLSRSHIMNILITTKDVIKLDYSMNVNVEYLSDLGLSSIEEIEDRYDVIVGGFELKKFNFSKLLNLKFIQLISSGYDYIDLDNNPNVMLSNARGVYSNAIAEWILSALLMEIKEFRTIFKQQIEKRWDRTLKSQDLKDKRIVVFGTGSIGSEVARLLNLLGVQVDGVNSNGRYIDGFKKTLSLSQSKTMMSDYDILIFCLPSNNETKNFLNESSILELNSGSIVINVGRGDLISKEAILKRSDVRFILDVHHIEPLPIDSELWNLDNLLISPHISFYSSEYVKSLKDLIQINISNLLDNKEVVNRVK